MPSDVVDLFSLHFTHWSYIVFTPIGRAHFALLLFLHKGTTVFLNHLIIGHAHITVDVTHVAGNCQLSWTMKDFRLLCHFKSLPVWMSLNKVF